MLDQKSGNNTGHDSDDSLGSLLGENNATNIVTAYDIQSETTKSVPALASWRFNHFSCTAGNLLAVYGGYFDEDTSHGLELLDLTELEADWISGENPCRWSSFNFKQNTSNVRGSVDFQFFSRNETELILFSIDITRQTLNDQYDLERNFNQSLAVWTFDT